MTVTTDSKKRVPLPTSPGERFDVQAFGNDKFVLTRLAPVELGKAKVKLAKRGAFTIGTSSQNIDAAALKDALKEWP